MRTTRHVRAFAGRTLAGLAAATIVLAGCTSDGGTAPAPEPEQSTAAGDADLLVDLGLDGLSGQEIVERLDTSSQGRPLGFAASVREDEVLIGDGTIEVAVELPGDQLYVSIAPYVGSTHDCYFHSLATCQGEMVEDEVHVRIVSDDGDVLIDETATTYANGFIGFWLPRDVTGTLEVTQDHLGGSVPFATTEGSPTCVTTLQLVPGGAPSPS
ncbi:CueP family metal-binding protein [Actinotalea sp. K2]|uniref:CueP family metal-binding protein n=1 Tax=Actinotalea sp. K2 TaxID=2939438 RepID=UPI00201768F0|nr:CueP family metal-binding protein [Actinotalea sp. K2]MCL3860393.1 CueP family metal-binding protein [Actinotalea sp. K2]